MHNQTELMDQYWQDRRLVNHVNAAFRRCRIGKVSLKSDTRRYPTPALSSGFRPIYESIPLQNVYTGLPLNWSSSNA